MNICIVKNILVLAFGFCFCLVYGQHEPSERIDKHPHQDNVEAYSGVTYNKQHKTNLFTLGFDYEHRFNWLDYRLGISLLSDYEFGHSYDRNGYEADSELLITPVVNFYPTEKFKVFAGGGMLFSKELTEPISRLGLGYEFEIHHKILIIPNVALDLGKDYQAYLAGISLGIGFH